MPSPVEFYRIWRAVFGLGTVAVVLVFAYFWVEYPVAFWLLAVLAAVLYIRWVWGFLHADDNNPTLKK